MRSVAQFMGVIPLTGTGQFGPIEMGGMFTILKVREGITSYEDPRPVPKPARHRRVVD